MSKFATKRFFLSAVGLAIATWLCYAGKLSGEQWVYAMAIVLAGHHAEDLIKVWRSSNAGAA